MPFDFYTERMATLGTTSDPAYSQGVRCDSEENVVFRIDFDIEGSDTASLQYQVSADGEGWFDSGSPLTASGSLEVGRTVFFRFKLTNTTGTPTEPIYVNIRAAIFCTESGGSFHPQNDAPKYAYNLKGLADTLATERANITIFGDSITNLNQTTFMGYGFQNSWRPNYFAGMCVPPTTGGADLSAHIANGPFSIPGASAFFSESTFASNCPDPEQPSTTYELQSLGLTPYAEGSDFLSVVRNGADLSQEVFARFNPIGNKLNGATQTLFRGKLQPTIDDIFANDPSDEFAVLCYVNQSYEIRFWPRNWTTDTNPPSLVYNLTPGFNIITQSTGVTGTGTISANISGTNTFLKTAYSEVYTRETEEGAGIAIVKAARRAADVPGICLDYIGGGGWESFDHTVEDPDDAQSLSFTSPAGTRKVYYKNAAVRQALKFHNTNIVMIWIGQNDDVSDDYRSNIIAMVDRIQSNASAVGLNPKILFIAPYLTSNIATSGGAKSRKQREILIDLCGKYDAGLIDLQQMIIDKHGEFSSWTGTYLADNVHPNTTGALEFAELIWTEVEKARTI